MNVAQAICLVTPALILSTFQPTFAEQPAAPAAKEKCLVVKVTDRAKTSSYQAMTPEEFKALDNEIRTESKFYSRARMAAEKAWRADETTKNKAFPTLPYREAKVIREFDDRAKAEEKISNIEQQERDAAKKDEERKQARQKNNPGGKPPSASDGARDALIAQAISVFEEHLRNCMTQAPAEAAKPEGPAQQQPAGGH